MKSTVATILLVVAMVAGQPARHQLSERQQVAPDALQPPAAQNAPYPPSGWRPQGAPFTLPSEQQTQYGAPAASYGPPATAYGPPADDSASTEDEIATTTYSPQLSKLTAESGSKKKSEAIKDGSNDRKAAYFVVLPQNAQFVKVPQSQSQNLVYGYAVEKSAPVVASVPQATLVAAPLTAQLQSLPVSTYKALYSPLTAPYVQVEW